MNTNTNTTDVHIEPTGQLREWMERFDLLDVWVLAKALPEGYTPPRYTAVGVHYEDE